MAGAGVFPKTATLDIIYQLDYNTIQSTVAGVLSTFYGQSMASSQVSANPLIDDTHWDNLRTDINTCYRHITNANSTISDVVQGSLVLAADANAYKVAADFCETNKLTAHPSQLASTVFNQSLTAAWNGTRTWTMHFTWGSAAAANFFFNAGGYFVVDVSGNAQGSTAPKDLDWQDNILNAIPTQTYTRANWVSTVDTGILVTENGNIGQYGENFARIQFFKVNDTQLNVIVTLSDADAGDQTGIGPPVDEDVNTDAFATITKFRSIDAVTGYDCVDQTITTW